MPPGLVLVAKLILPPSHQQGPTESVEVALVFVIDPKRKFVDDLQVHEHTQIQSLACHRELR